MATVTNGDMGAGGVLLPKWFLATFLAAFLPACFVGMGLGIQTWVNAGNAVAHDHDQDTSITKNGDRIESLKDSLDEMKTDIATVKQDVADTKDNTKDVDSKLGKLLEEHYRGRPQ